MEKKTVPFEIKMTLPDDPIHLHSCEEAFAMHLIDQAMARTRGNKTRAARLLSIKRTTLVMRLKKRKKVKGFDA